MEGPLISVKCLSEISLDREEEVEGKYHHLFREWSLYKTRKQYLCYIWGKDKAI